MEFHQRPSKKAMINGRVEYDQKSDRRQLLNDIFWLYDRRKWIILCFLLTGELDEWRRPKTGNVEPNR